MEWWGFSTEHGWVVLDRSIPGNGPGRRDDLLFVRCKDSMIFFEKREKWNPPAYTFAPNYLGRLGPAESAEAAAEFEALKARWPEFQQQIQRRQQEIDEEADALRAREDEARKAAAREKKKRDAAAKL